MRLETIDSFLNKVAPIGIVSLSSAIAFLIISYMPKETGFSGIEGLIDFLLSWGWAIVGIILFVPLNILGSFDKRRLFLMGYAIFVGVLLAIEIFIQELGTPKDCQVRPDYSFCATYNYFIEGILYPVVFGFGGVIVGFLTRFYQGFARLLDILQRFILSLLLPLIFTLFFIITIIFIPVLIFFGIPAWVWAVVLIRHRTNKFQLHP